MLSNINLTYKQKRRTIKTKKKNIKSHTPCRFQGQAVRTELRYLRTRAPRSGRLSRHHQMAGWGDYMDTLKYQSIYTGGGRLMDILYIVVGGRGISYGYAI